MGALQLLALSIAPGLAICIYIYWQDRFEKEPLKLLFTSFFLGIISVIPTLLLSTVAEWLGSNPGSESLLISLMSCILGIGLVEEYCKYIFVRYDAYKKNAFNEPYDGITYSVMVSMGFATLENILYVFGAESESGNGGLIGIMRMFTSVPAHASFAVIVGYHLGLAKYDNRKNHGLTGLAVASVLHGLYDFFLFNSHIPGMVLGALVSLYFGIRYSLKAIRLHQSASPYYGSNPPSAGI